MKRTNFFAFAHPIALLTCVIIAPMLTHAQTKKPVAPTKTTVKGTGHALPPRFGGIYAPYLNLTKTQETNLTAAVKALDEQSLTIQRDPKLTPEQKQRQILQLREKTKDRMADILTPEQKRKLVEVRRKQLMQTGALRKK